LGCTVRQLIYAAIYDGAVAAVDGIAGESGHDVELSIGDVDIGRAVCGHFKFAVTDEKSDAVVNETRD
jgi:hypothetical protein